MSRNELTFSIGDGEEGEFLLTEPAPAPEAPASGFAEVVNKPVELEAVSNVIQEDSVVPESRKRARRFRADVPFVMGLLLLLITAIAAASFYVSFSGLYAAAAWAVGDVPALQIAAPLMLDLSILAYSLSLFIKRERGERVLGTWIAIATFAAISAVANVLHTFAVSTATTPSELFIGATISGGAPLLLAFTTETIAKLVFKPIDPVTK